MSPPNLRQGLLLAQGVATAVAILVMLLWWTRARACGVDRGVIGFGLAGGLLVLGLFFPFLGPIWLRVKAVAILPLAWLLFVCFLAIQSAPRLCNGETPLSLSWPVALAGLAIAVTCGLAGRYFRK
ncbi:MAG TPA: hypothetical protein PLH11_10105 [Gemmobacter sp.]|nr:hypothetical protein [Gemmobacter sp.]